MSADLILCKNVDDSAINMTPVCLLSYVILISWQKVMIAKKTENQMM